MTDNYFSVGDRIEARIEKLEEDILMHTKKAHLHEIIGLRSEILWLKKVLGPQKEVINTLNKRIFGSSMISCKSTSATSTRTPSKFPRRSRRIGI